jgi:hypothetical protein
MTQPKIDWESLGKAAGAREKNTRPGIRVTRPPDWSPPRRDQPVKDLLGKSFGLITVIRQSVSDGHGSRWMCRCECGDERVVRRAEIVKGVKTHRSCKT